MALPATRTVTGTYVNPVTGKPRQGKVVFAPVPDRWTDTLGNQIMTGGGSVMLISGTFSVDLVTSDAAGVLPAANRVWEMKELIDGHWETWFFALPSGPGSIDITDLIMTQPSDIPFVPVQGPPGPQIYANLDAAAAAITTQSYVTNPTLPRNAVLLAFLAVRHAATNLNDTSQARIIPAAKFGVGPTSSGASLSGVALLTGATFTGSLIAGDASAAPVHTFNGPAGTLGFHGSTAIAKQTVSGSRSDGTALTNLLAALHNLGLITNSTSL